MMTKDDHRVDPGRILATGINDITDRYVFRAVIMEAVKAGAGIVSEDDMESELSAVYNMMVDD